MEKSKRALAYSWKTNILELKVRIFPANCLVCLDITTMKMIFIISYLMSIFSRMQKKIGLEPVTCCIISIINN